MRLLAHASQRKEKSRPKEKYSFRLNLTIIRILKYSWGTLSPIPPAKGNDSLWNPQAASQYLLFPICRHIIIGKCQLDPVLKDAHAGQDNHQPLGPQICTNAIGTRSAVLQ